MIKNLTDEYSRNVWETALAPEPAGHEWVKFRLVLFNLLVTGALLATFGSNLGAFYFGVAYAASSVFKPICLFLSMGAFIYEITHPQPLIKLVEAVYLGRHERDYKLEEEAYRLLQEVMRSPELLKSMCGTSLKGQSDPQLDELSEESRKKLADLERLGAKGFDVQQLKDELLQDAQINKDLL